MADSWRTFAPHIDDIAQKCSLHVETDEPFSLNGGPAGGGGTTAVQVTMNESKVMAWAKPARNNPAADINCAAHEKIAADLGYLLDLPIAPVVLSRKAEGLGLAPIVALSYEALEQGRPWGQAGALLTDEVRASIRATMSVMWAFHAWVNDSDHNWNDGNVLIEKGPEGTANLAFIDYSFALTKYWDPPGPPNAVFDWDRETKNYEPWDRAKMDEFVTRIEKLSSTDFGSVIQRMPGDCMVAETASKLFEGLDRRRQDLRRLLKL